ncbi:MAG TPA: response regulator [Candidatus Bathyarchaeia archaeon]|nr:response regulator [Candidatus Bathyarchaeia archaeon]
MIKHLKVLVVDDDPAILEVLAAHLRSKGYAVESRSSARNALDTMRRLPFDLVISDVRMAGMNGFEFIKIVRANFPTIGIVIMTAFEDEFPLSEALRAGADGYISKPFSLSKFSLIFERAYWHALQREDWWELHKGDQEKPLP